MLVASLSGDGGRTFRRSVRVDNETGACGDGHQDQPAAFVDFGTSRPTLWVVWRNANASILETYGGCVRHGVIRWEPDLRNQTIEWAGPAVPVANMDRGDELYGQGGLLIIAETDPGFPPSGTRVTVMYSNTDHYWDYCSGDKGIAWDVVSSDDLGASWYGNIHVAMTSSYDWCSANGQIINSLRDFWLAVDASAGAYWAAVHVSPGVINVYRSTDGGVSWPLMTTISAPSGGTVFQPNVAVDDDGRVAVSYFQSQVLSGRETNNIGRFIVANAYARTEPSSRWSPPYPVSPWFLPDRGQRIKGGDYQSMISVAPGVLPGGSTFFMAWSEEGTVRTASPAVSP